MAKVGIVMGSDSDMPVMSKAAAVLDELGISSLKEGNESPEDHEKRRDPRERHRDLSLPRDGLF